MVEALILVVFPVSMAYAALTDLQSMTIANSVPLVLAGAFALAALAIGMPLVAVAGHLAAGVVVLAAGFCLFRLGLMGGGDAKLMAASVLWFGFGPPALAYLVETSLLGGVLTFGLLALRGSVLAPLMSCKPALSHLVDPRAGVPYGIALAIAGLLAFPNSPPAVWAIARMAQP